MPNLLLVLLDDAGFADAGALGHPLLRTPHIDAFAAQAVRFTQAYAGAPNCSPSRATLLTGRASYRTGVYDFLSKHTGDMHLALSEYTAARILRDGGYATVHMGKWCAAAATPTFLQHAHAACHGRHLSRGPWGAPPSHFGFEHSNSSRLPATQLLEGFASWLRGLHGVGAGTSPRILTPRRLQQRPRPFFAYLALWEPHEPVDRWSPRRFQRWYADDDNRGIEALNHDASAPIVEARGKEASAVRGALLEQLAAGVDVGGGLCAWRLPRRAPPRVYYGCLSQVDAAFGRLLKTLEAIGVRHDTLLLLTSDNGPEHRERNSWGSAGGLRGAKGFLYEGGIRIPLLVQWPRALVPDSAPLRPRTVDEPTHFWDLLPTLADAAGVVLPATLSLDGQSLLPLLLPPQTTASRRGASAGGAAAATTGILGNDFGCFDRASTTPLWWAMHRGRGGMQYALREGDWKLLAAYDTEDGGLPAGDVTAWLHRARLGGVELYSLRADPRERVNLAPAQHAVATRMLRRLQRLLRQAARDGPSVAGWVQRPPVCPKWNARLNLTELCCQPLSQAEYTTVKIA